MTSESKNSFSYLIMITITQKLELFSLSYEFTHLFSIDCIRRFPTLHVFHNDIYTKNNTLSITTKAWAVMPLSSRHLACCYQWISYPQRFIWSMRYISCFCYQLKQSLPIYLSSLSTLTSFTWHIYIYISHSFLKCTGTIHS